MGAILVLSVFAAVIYFIARIKYLKGKMKRITQKTTPPRLDMNPTLEVCFLIV